QLLNAADRRLIRDRSRRAEEHDRLVDEIQLHIIPVLSNARDHGSDVPRTGAIGSIKNKSSWRPMRPACLLIFYLNPGRRDLERSVLVDDSHVARESEFPRKDLVRHRP